ncbi:MAG: PLP-dependent aminotransferase family protein [Parvibaculaceae bacterium]
MNKSTSDAALLDLALDRQAGEPLHAQLAEAIRRLILERRISAGARLPSSRMLAEELGVSRVTVVTAFDQLAAEGYADARRGSGLYVAVDLPDQMVERAAPPAASIAAAPQPPSDPRPFQPTEPDLSLFPYPAWAKLLERTWRAPSPALVNHRDPMGWLPLREAIAEHIGAARGIACTPAQVAVTSGIAESIDLVARALLPADSSVLVEDPGYLLLRRAFVHAGMRVEAVDVDASGFDVGQAGQAAAAAVTPSRQFPLGVTMPLPRRLQLLDWARRQDAIVIEDDYDSEYRYRGRPLPALMNLDREGRVVYLGSFSKVLSSSLRLAYAVVPEARVEALRNVLGKLGAKASLAPQPALAEFMASGQFAAHIRRMRRLYARRQEALLRAAETHLPRWLTVGPEAGGLHLIAEPTPALARRMDDTEASALAADAGVIAPALSLYYSGAPRRQGLLLGYAGFDEVALEEAARRLAEALI